MASIAAIVSAIISIVGAIAAYICFYLSQKDRKAVITPELSLNSRGPGRGTDIFLAIVNSGERMAKEISIKLTGNTIAENSATPSQHKVLYRSKIENIAPKEGYLIMQQKEKPEYADENYYFAVELNYSDLFSRKKRSYSRAFYYKIKRHSIIMCANPKIS